MKESFTATALPCLAFRGKGMPDVTSVSHCWIVIVQGYRPCFALRPCRMADRIPIIMNPAARSAKAARVVARIAALSPAPEMHFTEYPGHATQIAEKLAREGRELVVAAGGDGTVNEVLQGLSRVNAERSDVSHHTALGTLPAGTMNVPSPFWRGPTGCPSTKT